MALYGFNPTEMIQQFLLPKEGTNTTTGARSPSRTLNTYQQTIPNPEYDVIKGGQQYEELPEGYRIGPEDTIIKETAPRNLGRLLTGGFDKLTGNKWDFDQRGAGPDKWGELPEEGTLGGLPIEIKRNMLNPHYNASTAQNPVPELPDIDYGDRSKNDAYQLGVDLARSDQFLNQALKYGTAGQDIAYQYDKAQMFDYLNTERGQAEVDLMRQAAFDSAVLAQAEARKGVAAQQLAANEFGTLHIPNVAARGGLT